MDRETRGRKLKGRSTTVLTNSTFVACLPRVRNCQQPGLAPWFRLRASTTGARLQSLVGELRSFSLNNEGISAIFDNMDDSGEFIPSDIS